MREIKLELENAKKRVKLLQNKDIMIRINKGRNKFVNINGKITDIYPSIFVIQSSDDNKLYTHSYNDILIKTVQFFKSIPVKPQ